MRAIIAISSRALIEFAVTAQSDFVSCYSTRANSVHREYNVMQQSFAGTVHFLRFWLKAHFASTKFAICSRKWYRLGLTNPNVLYYYGAMIAGTKFYVFEPILRNIKHYIVPAKNSHLKVVTNNL